MAMLSPEIDRFLGQALLDAALARHVFSVERAKALSGYNLLPEVSATIMASKAHTLPELARELWAAFAVSVPADAEGEVERFYQTVHATHASDKPISIRQVQAIAQKVINQSSVAQDEEYAELKSA